MGRRLLFLAVALVALAAEGQQARPIRARQLRSTSAPVPRIVNGERAGGFYPTVGALFRNGSFYCSGVLIGCHTFMTAGHCISNPIDPAQYSVFLQHVGFVGASSIVRNPDAAFGVRSDQSLLTLSTSVSGIDPSRINTIAEPPLGTLGDIAGFGSVGEIFGPGTSNYLAGIKRRGDVVTAACTVVPESSHICWSFATPLGPPGTDSNTCKGDSGGPLFATVAGLGTALVGTTSGGNSSCLPDETPFDADTHFDHEWIESVAGADLAPVSCGSIPPVLGPGSEVLYDQFTMDSTDGGWLYDFMVPPGKNILRVTTNGETTPFQNYDLYVKLGGEPSVDPPDYDCASTRGGDSFEACAFDAPAGGQWFVLVDNPSSSDGEYDLTVSILGGPTPTLDIDGDAKVLPLTDGLLFLRYLFGFRGAVLINDVLGDSCSRCVSSEIEEYIDSLL